MARSDVQLMLGVKAGDDASFELLLEKYRTPLVHFLFRIVRDAATAEDLAQEVFLRVYRARKKYAPSAKFTTWLFRIATNIALNSIRDTRNEKMGISIDDPASAGAGAGGGARRSAEHDRPRVDVPDKQPGMVERMMERDRAEVIQRAILALPEKQRVAVLLHKYHDLDYDEIARVLDCSQSALKSLLFRAYETLRVELATLVKA